MNTLLIEFRKSLGLTTEEMAKRVGVSTSFYEKIEYGDRNPSFNFITAFKKTFPMIDVDRIFFNHNEHKTCSE
ncbi:helix-turn-helix transcriptional regulator [Anaerosalibacter bizertensis]|uniref:Helix-turn-helix transcriptional regulator n=1 Tax=Anaerosalibacter bizertensis TaxID=932217 RepID=A0A844FHV7_9FIRM|nr:helix-turn-helix transcriptional regulator [Anaerosalibacter bizertensis]MSS43663.1 helix-turn-helix transcriptional regulator [Anaerosalibacter bizertensis]